MTTVYSSLDATVGEFKNNLIETLLDDEVSKKLALVELLLAEEPLRDDSVTLAETGIAEDVVVLAVRSQRTASCLCAAQADFDGNDPDRFVLLSIPDGTREIMDDVFRSCHSVAGVTIPESVTKIGAGAFADCSSLIWLRLPASLTKIEREAFENCTSLTSVTIPASVTMIEPFSFFGCSSLTSLTIPDSVTEIAEYAFYGCSSLTCLTIPSSVKHIGREAFSGCRSLTSLSIPKSVQLGRGVFDGCGDRMLSAR